MVHRSTVVILLSLSLLLPGGIAERVRYKVPQSNADDWKWITHADDSKENNKPSLVFDMALKHHDNGHLSDLLANVSTPTHPMYTDYPDLPSLRHHLAAVPDPVVAWLTQHSPEIRPSVSALGDWITFRTDLLTASSLFQTTFSVFSLDTPTPLNSSTTELSSGSGSHRLRLAASEYFLPSLIAAEVDFVTGFELPVVKRADSTEPASAQRNLECYGKDPYPGNTPETMYPLYNVTSRPKFVAKTTQALFIESENPSDSDVQLFFSKYAPELKGQKATRVGGDDNVTDSGGEATLDTEYIMSFGRWVPTVYWNFYGGTEISTWRSLVAVMADVAADPKRPSVISSSFGPNEVNAEYAPRLDVELQKLGVLGVSVLIASGDTGCGLLEDCSTYDLEVPNSPYITLVGAVRCDPAHGSLSAAPISSGGFSATHPMPAWQKRAVEGYLSSGVRLPPASMYNSSNRAGPDIALCGCKVEVVFSGKRVGGGGTSFSSPQLAGIISSLNELRVAAGKATLGFLNPLLYHLSSSCPACFTDILTGSNGVQTPSNLDAQCNADRCGARKCMGWDATQGWDPATGVGMPNVGVLEAAIMALG